MISLTYDEFEEFKSDYPVYGTHTEQDQYRNEFTVVDSTPRGMVHTMWHPLTDAASVAEYGKDISKMVYAVIYEAIDIQYGDIVNIRGDEYEVVGIKYFNTFTRIEAKRKKA